MIDIHSHFLFGVDDGSPNLEVSLNMLKRAYADGVTDIICTPHYRSGVFEPDVSLIKANFERLKSENPYPVNLYLGQEIAKCRDMFGLLKSGKVLTVNDSKYVLLEFKYVEDSEIENTVLDAVYSGYKPIIAHVERYEYVKERDIERFIDAGAYIQVNADSLVSKRGEYYKKRVEKYIRSELVDFVANDMHYNREYCMKAAFDYVSKKFGKQVANALFIENPEVLIEK
ncbi:MAG: tyrosine protein phosphatase [Clostridia bacterium]|nr:tyrosine protein phosphatase [Clostridia bacterium]